MRTADVPVAERLSAEAFYQVDLATRLPTGPEPTRRSGTRTSAWLRRTENFLSTDPDGCVVADDDAGMAGFATSIRRDDTLWCLATFAVRPGLQGQGIGRRLLEEAARHGDGCARWMLAASDDPRAVRRYRAAGFDLHPAMTLAGTLDRSMLPRVTGIREAVEGDLAVLDELGRQVRGAAHGPDHGPLAAVGTPLVDTRHRGFAYAGRSGPTLLAAIDEDTATRLLWACLARAEDAVAITHVTAANQWALDVGMAARLTLTTHGYLGVRGMAPPVGYLHHGSVL